MFNCERERTINAALTYAARFVICGNLCDAKAAIAVAECGYQQIKKEKNVWINLLRRYADFNQNERE